MQGFLLALGCLAVILSVYVALTYDELVSARQCVDEGWRGIDVQLKRRSDLILNLVESVRACAPMKPICLIRSAELGCRQAMPARHDLQQADRLWAGRSVAFWRCRKVKASKSFQYLHKAIERIEADIQYARRYFNGAMGIMNTKVQAPPFNLVARRFGLGPSRFFGLEPPAEGELPNVRY